MKNREIKFRAWNTEVNHMAKVVTVQEMLAYCPEGEDCDSNLEWYNENLIIMQYTGLKDKNGKEIYEGDVVEYWYELSRNQGKVTEQTFEGVVVFKDVKIENGYEPDSRHIGFVLECKNEPQHGGDTWYTDLSASNLEIIGNIYENPELLDV